MTAEEQKHYDEYISAKKIYENTAMDRRRAENERCEIYNRRHYLIDEINRLESERNKNIDSLEEITKSTDKNSDFEMGMTDSDSKLETAANSFCAIGSSSIGCPQNLTDVFDEKNRLSKKSISDVFESLRNIKNVLTDKIDQLSDDIHRYECEIEEGRARECHLDYSIDEMSRTMNNASMDMAYHKKFIP